MLDDYKYSLTRIVAYQHKEPLYSDSAYGPGGAERTYGIVKEIRHTDGDSPRWEYSIANAFTGEVRCVDEDDIFHGVDKNYLETSHHDDIPWVRRPPENAKGDEQNGFWNHTLKQFIRAAIPRIIEQEHSQEQAKEQGLDLEVEKGDYIRVRGDIRPDMEYAHNLYAKVIEVSPADCESLYIPRNTIGIAAGLHKVTTSYLVELDTGEQANVYDVEIKSVYTSNGRKVVLNWRAATFLSEAFGDEMPHDVQLEYLKDHLFSRAELEGLSQADLADLLVRLLYVKGIISWDELEKKATALSRSTAEYLIDQLLEYSRFDMEKNRSLTSVEIAESRSGDDRLRNLIE